MTENLKKFLVEVSTDKALCDKVIQLNKDCPDKDANIEKLILLAKTKDLALAADDFADDNANIEVEDEGLDNIAGGSYVLYDSGYTPCLCFCGFGGGGSSDKYQKTCACIAAGAGELTELGKKMAKEGHLSYLGSKSDPVAMACAVVGVGA